MLHRYFGECVNFTRKQPVNSIHRKTMLKQYFLSNLDADREWESKVFTVIQLL